MLLAQRGVAKDRLEGQVREDATTGEFGNDWRVLQGRRSDRDPEYLVYIEPFHRSGKRECV